MLKRCVLGNVVVQKTKTYMWVVTKLIYNEDCKQTQLAIFRADVTSLRPAFDSLTVLQLEQL